MEEDQASVEDLLLPQLDSFNLPPKIFKKGIHL